LQKKAEELYDGVSRFKNKFDKTEKDLNYNIQQNIKRVEDFENRVTGFMNDLIEEYEKRFEAIKKELKMVPSQIAVSDVEQTGFLNRMKNVISKPNDRVFELEVKVKEQQILLKKMLEELKDLTRTELGGEKNVGERREQ
jgi:DNA anti-recombination protein RmuC